jgi:hypothetical protein
MGMRHIRTNRPVCPANWEVTKMKKIVLVLILGVAFGAIPGHAEPAIQTEEYVAGFLGDAVLNLCADDNPTGMNIERVCFDVSANKQYRVNITDLMQGTSVGYLYVFRNAAGNCVGDDPDDPLGDCPNSGLTCGTQTLSSPPGAVELTITLDGPVFGPLDCLVGGPGDSIGMATTGTVKLTRL